MTDAADSQTNPLFICVDCLRADAISDGWGETPFIDSLVADGYHYTQLFGTATTTTPCVASFMTGRYGERNGITSLTEAKLASGVPTLAEQFSQAGYTTAGMAVGPLVPETNLDRGFDRYWYSKSVELSFGDWPAMAEDRLTDLEEPFFCYLHLWELHDPIDVPERYDAPKYGRWPYERALSALDPALERIAECLPADTAIALHGDHGESITWNDHPFHHYVKRARDKLRYEQGLDIRRAERALNRLFDSPDSGINDHFIEEEHGETVFDHAAQVPFVLALPDGDSARVDALCRQVDIHPTLLDAMEIEHDGDIDGETLLPPEVVADRDAYVRACGTSLRGQENRIRAVRTADTKYLEYPERDWPAELYDLADDPRELSPIHDPARKRAMCQRLPTFDTVDAERLDIDDRLRDLGYL